MSNSCPLSPDGSTNSRFKVELTGIIFLISLVHSHWSRNVEAWLSLVESFIMLKYFHGIAMTALLCHKEPAQGMKNAPDIGGILCPKDLWLTCTGRSYEGRLSCTERIFYPYSLKNQRRYFACLELCLYGIRELSSDPSST